MLGSHQKCWLWGRHVVLETLRAGRWCPLELWLSTSLEAPVAQETRRLAAQPGIDIEVRSADELTRRCGKTDHQGLIARMPQYPCCTVDDLWRQAAAPRLFVVLDGIEDPFNFGAIIRSAEVFAASGVLIGARRQSEITAQVVRSSAGAVNYVSIARVDDLAAAVRTLSSQSVAIVAASEKAAHDAAAFDFAQDCALIIGSEGRGVSDELRDLCDATVAIPQSGRIGSLNAAVAAGILLYEVSRQRAVH